MTDIDTCFNMISDVPTALTFIYLVHIADEEGRVNLSYTDMAKALNCPRSTLHKYVRRMVEIGVVQNRREQSVNRVRTEREQSVNKKTSIFIPQISDYKQVVSMDKNRCEQSVNRVRTEREQSVNKKRTLDERKKDFVERLKPYMETYSKDMLNDFYRYWSQVNENGTKMLYEKQKCFEISKRLATWKRNEEERKRPQRTEDIGVVLEKVNNKFDNEEEF